MTEKTVPQPGQPSERFSVRKASDGYIEVYLQGVLAPIGAGITWDGVCASVKPFKANPPISDEEMSWLKREVQKLEEPMIREIDPRP
jgi:hypothetical protein